MLVKEIMSRQVNQSRNWSSISWILLHSSNIQQVVLSRRKKEIGKPEIMRAKSASASELSLRQSDELPFSFRSQRDFNAAQDLLRSRSECFLESKRARDKLIREEEMKNRTPWDMRPPDFTLQLYQPKPPKRNSRYAMIPGYNEDEWNKKAREKRRQRVQFEPIPLPKILQQPVSDKPPFSTQFRIPDSHQAKIMYVRNGIHRREPYTAPGPHAFRGDDFRPVSTSGGGN